MKVHESAEFYTLDEVSETMDVSRELGSKLYGFLTSVELPKDGPLYETPGDALGQGPNILADHWNKFSDEEQRELSKALDSL
jgi:hypothetical protein